MTAHCTICSLPLDMPGRPWTRSCGGDCLACMGEGDGEDLECEAAIAAMRAGEAVVKAARRLLHFADYTVDGGSTVQVTRYDLHELRDALPAEKGGEG